MLIVFSRCAAAGGGHRGRIAATLCDILRSSGLGGSVQQMVLRCVLEDETVTVKVFDKISQSNSLSYEISGLFMMFVVVLRFRNYGLLDFFIFSRY